MTRSVISAADLAVIARTEQICGVLALIFAVVMAVGNSRNVLWKIAEHSMARSVWVVIFGLMGLCLVMAPKLSPRRGHYVLCVVSAMFYAYFAALAYNVDAIGAAMMGMMCVVYLGWIAKKLHQGGSNGASG